ncbi:ornithine decarboxylase antizyme-domain-containing protein [Massariosphaeria phaeospora]|uniref:Ornithine decarboxylase antizyme n=1 Tax=Massariosphaeria phaeospora TaxID=100035 RepID=A0A7C8MI32_9PLEO|nr:ornithine decarboxylase antizyme-domain-containing protein [Massariosphaeria phaeospora]
MPSPPLSPPLDATQIAAKISPSDVASRSGRARRGGAAYTITGECERLFCETLRAVFLGEGNLAGQDSLVMGMHDHGSHVPTTNINDYGVDLRRRTDRLMDSPPPDMVGPVRSKGIVSDWVEMWDYVGGNRFRGFVAEQDQEKAMFVFFDQSVIGGDLKAGLMALLELCEVSYFSCDRLVVCIDRRTESEALIKDLGWIGFQLATLNNFTRDGEITSEKWLFMEMEA